eukprot:Rhum_TRINITY_DN8456_c0_g2::Rhum_TRINITY_DN8456_c0_g2_i1::g.28099::m.28099
MDCPDFVPSWTPTRANLFYEQVKEGNLHVEWPEVVVVLEGTPEVRACFMSEDLEAGYMTPLAVLRRSICSTEDAVCIERIGYADEAAVRLLKSGRWRFVGKRGVIQRDREHQSYRRFSLQNGVKGKSLEAFDHNAAFPRSVYSMHFHEPSDCHHFDMRSLGSSVAHNAGHIAPRATGQAPACAFPSTAFSTRKTQALLKKAKTNLFTPAPLVLIASPLPEEAPHLAPSIKTAWTGSTPLHHAAATNDAALARHVLTACAGSPKELFFILHGVNLSHRTPLGLALLRGSEDFIIEVVEFLQKRQQDQQAGEEVDDDEDEDGYNFPVLLKSELRRLVAGCVRASLLRCVRLLFPDVAACVRAEEAGASEVRVVAEVMGLGLHLDAELLSQVRGPDAVAILRCVEPFVDYAAVHDLTPFFRPGRASLPVLTYLLGLPAVLQSVDKKLKWSTVLTALVVEDELAVLAFLLGDDVHAHVRHAVRRNAATLLPLLLRLKVGAKTHPAGYLCRAAQNDALLDLLRGHVRRTDEADDGRAGEGSVVLSSLATHILVRGEKYPHKEQYKNALAFAVEADDVRLLDVLLKQATAADLNTACIVAKQRNRHLFTLTPLSYALSLKRRDAFCAVRAAGGEAGVKIFTSDLPWAVPDAVYPATDMPLVGGRARVPKDVWLTIASYALPTDLGCLECCCRALANVISQSALWANLMPFLHDYAQTNSPAYRKLQSRGKEPLPPVGSMKNVKHVFSHGFTKGVFRKDCSCFVPFVPSEIAGPAWAVGGVLPYGYASCSPAYQLAGSEDAPWSEFSSPSPSPGGRASPAPLQMPKEPRAEDNVSALSFAKNIHLLPGSMLNLSRSGDELAMLLETYETEAVRRRALRDTAAERVAASPRAAATRLPLKNTAHFLNLLEAGFEHTLPHTRLLPDMVWEGHHRWADTPAASMSSNRPCPRSDRVAVDDLEEYTFYAHPLIPLLALFATRFGTDDTAEARSARSDAEERVLRLLAREHARAAAGPPPEMAGVRDAEGYLALAEQGERGRVAHVAHRALLGCFWMDERRAQPGAGGGGDADEGSETESGDSEDGSGSGDGGSAEKDAAADVASCNVTKRLAKTLPTLVLSVLGHVIRCVKHSDAMLRAVWRLSGPSFLTNPDRYPDVAGGRALKHALYCGNEPAVFFFLRTGEALEEALTLAAPPSCRLPADEAAAALARALGYDEHTVRTHVQAAARPELARELCEAERSSGAQLDGGSEVEYDDDDDDDVEGDSADHPLRRHLERHFSLDKHVIHTAINFSQFSIFSAVVGSANELLQRKQEQYSRGQDALYAAYRMERHILMPTPILYCAVLRGSSEGLLVLRHVKEFVETVRRLRRRGGDEADTACFLTDYEALLDKHLEESPEVVLGLQGGGDGSESCGAETPDGDGDRNPYASCSVRALSYAGLPAGFSFAGGVHEVNKLACFLGREQFLVTSLFAGYYDIDSDASVGGGDLLTKVQRAEETTRANVRVKELILAAKAGGHPCVLELLSEVFLDESDPRWRAEKEELACLRSFVSCTTECVLYPSVADLGSGGGADGSETSGGDDCDDASYDDPSLCDSPPLLFDRGGAGLRSMMRCGLPQQRPDFAYNVMALPCIDCVSPLTSDVMCMMWTRAGPHGQCDLVTRSLLCVERGSPAAEQPAVPFHYPLFPITLEGGPTCYDLFEATRCKGWGLTCSYSRGSTGSWHAVSVKNLRRYTPAPTGEQKPPVLLVRTLTLHGGVGEGTLRMPMVCKAYLEQTVTKEKRYGPARFMQIVLTRKTVAEAHRNPSGVLNEQVSRIHHIWKGDDDTREASLFVFVAPKDDCTDEYEIVYVAAPMPHATTLRMPHRVTKGCFKTPESFYHRSMWDSGNADEEHIYPGTSVGAYEAETKNFMFRSVPAEPSLVTILQLSDFESQPVPMLSRSVLLGGV